MQKISAFERNGDSLSRGCRLNHIPKNVQKSLFLFFLIIMLQVQNFLTKNQTTQYAILLEEEKKKKGKAVHLYFAMSTSIQVKFF